MELNWQLMWTYRDFYLPIRRNSASFWLKGEDLHSTRLKMVFRCRMFRGSVRSIIHEFVHGNQIYKVMNRRSIEHYSLWFLRPDKCDRVPIDRPICKSIVRAPMHPFDAMVIPIYSQILSHEKLEENNLECRHKSGRLWSFEYNSDRIKYNLSNGRPNTADKILVILKYSTLGIKGQRIFNSNTQRTC